MGGSRWIEWKPSRRDELISLARYGKITPEQAEAAAKAEGLEPFAHEPPLPDFDPMAEPRWTIVMAVAWIAWRDITAVRENAPGFAARCTLWIWREWNEPVENGTAFATRAGWFLETWHERTTIRLSFEERYMKETATLPLTWQMSVADAERSLWRAAGESRLIAEGMSAEGRPVDIPSREWSYLKLFEDGKRDVLRYEALDRHEPYRDVKLKRDDLLRLWPPAGATVKTENECGRWLAAQMRQSPDFRPKPKALFALEAKALFPGLADRQFTRSWDWAIRESGAHVWSKPGRPPQKSNRRTK